jgi:hypothetical protein
MDEKTIDPRIVDGNLVEEALKTQGMQLCLEEWEAIKTQALKDIMNESIYGNEGLSIKDYQVKLYNQITEWLYVPQMFIRKKKFALSEREKKAEVKEVPPFMEGRG